MLTLFSGGAFVAIAWFFRFLRWSIELSRKRPTSDAERIARLLAEQARKLGAAEQREKDYQSAIDAMDTDRAGRDFVHGEFERTSRQAERAAAIIDQIRNFDRKAEGKPQVFDPREAVMWALSVMGEHLRLRDIKVVTRIPDRCRRVSGHGIRFKHVVLNLLTNARDAIELRAGNKDGATSGRRIELEVSDDTSADTLQLLVRDTGSGIPEAVMGRIFESVS